MDKDLTAHRAFGLQVLQNLACPVAPFLIAPTPEQLGALGPGPFALRSLTYDGPAASVNLAADQVPVTDSIVQVMITGFAHGRLFTRNPTTGAKRPSAEVYLGDAAAPLPWLSLEKSHPQPARQLLELAARLEAHLREALQIDFVVNDNGLQLLDLRVLARSPQAAVKIAVSLVEEQMITREEALLKVDSAQINSLLRPTFDAVEVRQAIRQGRLVCQGEGVQGGVVCARVALSVEAAWELHGAGELVALVCDELTYLQRDVLAFVNALVVRDGKTARFAAHRMGLPCVVAPSVELLANEWIAVDANNGMVLRGKLTILWGSLSADAQQLLGWADEVAALEVRANLGGPADVSVAQGFGAQNVGLFRIEHLFQTRERLPLFQRTLRELCAPRGDAGVAQAMQSALSEDVLQLFLQWSPADKPIVVVRLLDAPLAYMMRYWREQRELDCDYFSGPLQAWLHELSPMQGLRCGRLSLIVPALLRLQLAALVGAWKQAKEAGRKLHLQIMMPGVCDARELEFVRSELRQICAPGEAPELGSMLEVPRACLTADKLACQAEFLIFGTGDLTESTLAMSRYDCHLSFLPDLLALGLLPEDPYRSIDEEGVGELMRIAIERARGAKPGLEMGCCGAQATDPASTALCHRLGLDFVSVPVAHVASTRLAAAHAQLRYPR